MKYQFRVEITGFLEIEANSEQEAIEIVEDGYSILDIQVEDTEEELIGEIKEANHKAIKEGADGTYLP